MEAWVEAQGSKEFWPDCKRGSKWLGESRRATRRRGEGTHLEPV